jgi:CelD/BcsL family acetyltransferase involved in cellulose biosynthesis
LNDLSSLRAEVVTELGDLAPFEAEWRNLAAAQGNGFLTPEWFRAWHETSDDHLPLLVAVHGIEGRLVAIVPFSRAAKRPRLVRFAGASEGDRFGPACLPGAEGPCIVAAIDAVRALEASPAAIVLDRVDAEPEAWPAALGDSLEGITVFSDRSAALHVADLSSGSWDGYLATLSAKLRKRLRYLDRALRREGEVNVREISDQGELPEALATLFELHDRRWAERGGSSLAESGRVFHRRFAAAALEQGWLRLRILEIDGVPAAVLYGWRLGPSYAFYQGGFDPAWASHSVGMVLLADTIRAAVEEGAQEFDLLLGDEPYKLRFAGLSRPIQSLTLVGQRHPYRLAAGAEHRLRRSADALDLQRRLPPSLARALGRRLPSSG